MNALSPLKAIVDAYVLWRACGIRLDTAHSTREIAYQKYFSEHPEMFVAAYAGETLIGLAVCFFDGRKGSIFRLAIEPTHRRMGLAKQIIGQAEELLRSLGASSVYCLIEDDNSASIGLFSGLGYNEYGNVRYLSKDLPTDGA